MNASPAAIINTPPSAENLKLKAGMPSQERPLIYSGVCVCFITAAVGNISPEQIIPLFFSLPIVPSSLSSSLRFSSWTGCASPLISSFFVLFLLAVSFVCRSFLAPLLRLCTRLQPVMQRRSEGIRGCHCQCRAAGSRQR